MLCICALSSGTFYTYSVVLHHSSVPDPFSYSLAIFPMQWYDRMGGELCPKSLEQAVELGEGVGFVPWSPNNVTKRIFEARTLCLHFIQINTSEVCLQVAVMLHVRSPENCFVLWPACTTEALVSAVLSSPYNWRIVGLLIGKTFKAKQNNKADVGVWLLMPKKLSLLQTWAYFPSIWCLSKLVQLLLLKTKNLKVLGTNMQQLHFWSLRGSLFALLTCFVGLME